jgi:hypothetical protein
MSKLSRILYPQGVQTKATMTEVEQFAKWTVELVSEAVVALEDGKLTLNEYPAFINALWGAKDAFTGIKQFDDEFRQATVEDYEHLKNTVVSSIKSDKIPAAYIDLLSDTAIINFKFYKATRELLKKDPSLA